MKYLSTLFCLCLFVVVNGQSIENGQVKMSLGNQPSYSVTIEGANEKMAKSVFKDMMKDYKAEVKYNKKAKEYYSVDAVIGPINGTKPTDIYFRINEGEGESTVHMWVDLKGEFANHESSATEAMAVESWLTDYYLTTREKAIEKELERETDALADLEKALSKLEKKNKSLRDDIEKYKEKIARAERDIEENLSEQDDKKVYIKKQTKTVEAVKSKLNKLDKSKG